MLHKASKRDAEQLVGRTDHFRAVIVARGEHRPGDLVNVKIDRSTGATLFGEVV
jgi:tRNA-2-methylthio-N6-dimethylallyladenosine synthase